MSRRGLLLVPMHGSTSSKIPPKGHLWGLYSLSFKKWPWPFGPSMWEPKKLR